jgi:hypothetical protein
MQADFREEFLLLKRRARPALSYHFNNRQVRRILLAAGLSA